MKATTLKLEIELSYDSQLVHGGDEDEEAKQWFFNEILSGEKGLLWLHSNEIGDTLGKVKVIKLSEEAQRITLEPICVVCKFGLQALVRQSTERLSYEKTFFR